MRVMRKQTLEMICRDYTEEIDVFLALADFRFCLCKVIPFSNIAGTKTDPQLGLFGR